MSLFKDNINRREFIDLLKNSNLIYNESNKCLKPCYNVYYHFYYATLGMTRDNLDISSDDIQMSLATLANYIPQLIRLRANLIGLYNQNPKIFKKFEIEFLDTVDNLGKLYTSISLLLNDSKKIREYRRIVEISTMIAYLEEILKQLITFKPLTNITNVPTNIGNGFTI